MSLLFFCFSRENISALADRQNYKLFTGLVRVSYFLFQGLDIETHKETSNVHKENSLVVTSFPAQMACTEKGQKVIIRWQFFFAKV